MRMPRGVVATEYRARTTSGFCGREPFALQGNGESRLVGSRLKTALSLQRMSSELSSPPSERCISIQDLGVDAAPRSVHLVELPIDLAQSAIGNAASRGLRIRLLSGVLIIAEALHMIGDVAVAAREVGVDRGC